jgi:methionyl-tRNA formyltransferase
MRRVLLIGQGPTAVTALASLLERFEVVGVVRSTADADDPVIRLAMASAVKVHLDASLPAVERLIECLKPDCVVVSSYDRILAPALLQRCRFVNVHYADLPRYRGRATVNWAILNGESHTAISIHELRTQLDGGPILFKQCVPIGPGDTVATLYDRLNAIQQQALGRTVEGFLDGHAGATQVEADATYGCTRLPADGEIDWRRPAREIDALVRALVAPFPGAFTYLAGERLVVWQAEVVADPTLYVGRIPGRVISRSRADGWVDVLTGEGVLRLRHVERAGAGREPAARVITSVKMTLGLGSAELLARIRALEHTVTQLANVVRELIDDRRQTDSHHGRSGADRIAHRGSAGRTAAR